MNFLDTLTAIKNYKETENGALAFKSTNDKVYDLFALGGAYRTRTEADTVLLFKEAYDENPSLALKCLFYLRDILEGQGERRFFRICYHWLADNDVAAIMRTAKYVPEYGRWDDLIYTLYGTRSQLVLHDMLQEQLQLDLSSKTPSLLGKWMPSENASSKETKEMASNIRRMLGLNHKKYRQMLSILRKRINIVERLMSENRWNEIEFDKIPSKAGLIYKNAFARREILQKKYEIFVKSKDTKVNADTLYPYEIVEKAIKLMKLRDYFYYSEKPEIALDNLDRLVINKYWENQKNWFGKKECSMMCVVDTSGSMYGRPLDIACSLGLYTAERLQGPFHNHYISFSYVPKLVETVGVDFCDKVQRIYTDNCCENTNLTAVFDMLLTIARLDKEAAATLPKTLVVISDMEIDYQSDWTSDTAVTELEKIREQWNYYGFKIPRLIYWNVEARNNTFLDKGEDVSFVSGASPAIFECIMTGKTGKDLMLEKLLSNRYKNIN